MSTNEMLLLLVAPGVVLVVLALVRGQSRLFRWSMLSVVVAGELMAALLFSRGQGAFLIAATLGVPLGVMLGVLHCEGLVKRPVLQLLLGIPVYLLALMLLVSLGVTLGLLTP